MRRSLCWVLVGMGIAGAACAQADTDDGGGGGAADDGPGPAGPGSGGAGGGIPAGCGNGEVDPGEACDDGNNAPDDGCSATCTLEGCGNGAIEGIEVCDDGNTAPGDGCSSTCDSDESCGNGVTDAVAGESCDDGNTADGDGCSSTCEAELCGDGAVTGLEVCDDGNTTDGDGCSAGCDSDESCGNDIIDVSVGEECDEGDVTAGDGCSPACHFEVCGNGFFDPGEQCDDGNTTDGDGCTATCQSESCQLNAAIYPAVIAGSTFGLGQMAFDGGCNVIVVFGSPKNLVRLDQQSGVQTTLATNIGAGNYLLGLAYRASDDMAYVSADSGQIHSVDAGGAVALIHSHSTEVEALAVAPGGFGAFGGQLIATTYDGMVLAIDPAGPTVTTVGQTTGVLSSLAFGADGTLYVVNYTNGTVSTVSSAGTFSQVATVTGPDGIAVDDLGSRLFVSNQEGDTLHAVALPGGAVTGLGSYDFDNTWFVSGMLFDGTRLLLGTGEGPKTLTAIVP